jgi:hypothetical protein
MIVVGLVVTSLNKSPWWKWGFGKLECQLHLYKKKLKSVQSNVFKFLTLELKFINISPTKIRAFTKPCMKTYMIYKIKQRR